VQHIRKPCQHGLAAIIAQDVRNVGMENFVDDYYSIDKFRKALQIDEAVCLHPHEHSS
jgi:hypothetical protein